MLPPRATVAAAVLLGLGAVPATAGASSHLSPRLARIASPKLRAAPPARQARAVDLPGSGAASLVRRGDRVVVEIRTAPSRLAALRAAGARLISVHPRYRTIVASVAPGRLRAVGAVPGVRDVTEALAPIVSGAGGSCQGAVVAESDLTLRAALVRRALGVDGSGVKVGVLSDSYDHKTGAIKDVQTGDLPGSCGHTDPVEVLDDSNPDIHARDEGRALLQVVHDLAPGAQLEFATVGPTEFDMAANIRALAAGGAKVIVDDVAFPDEPMFQDGPVADAIADVTARGVAYFTAAGNDNVRAGNADVGSWESPAYRPAACPPGVSSDVRADDCESFRPGDRTYDISVPDGREVKVELQWAEPRDGVKTDLNLGLVVGGNTVAYSSEPNDTASQKPREVLKWTNNQGASADAQLVVARATTADGGTPRIKLIRFENAASLDALPEPAYRVSRGGDVVGPTIFGHNGATAAITLAAVPASNAATVEPYSSRGPVTHYFGPVTSAAPAAPLAAPRVIAKPDLAASDCVMTTFFAPSTHRFCGTSAAAPAAAAIAALQLAADPSLTPRRIRALQLASGRPVGAFGPLAEGSGLVDAVAAAPAADVTAKGPRGATRDRTPTFRLDASHRAKLRCSLDGRAAKRCSRRWTAPRLHDGRHTLVVRAVDALGHTGRSAPRRFRVDTTGPRVRLRHRPRKRTRRRRGTFAFVASERGARYRCSVDGGRFRACHSPRRVRVGRGRHRFRVRALDRLGNRGRVAAYRWRVVG